MLILTVNNVFHSMGSVLQISTTVSDISFEQIPCKGFATCLGPLVTHLCHHTLTSGPDNTF